MVRVAITAFDKNSSNFHGGTITAETKEEFNKAVKEFEDDVPFSKYFIEMEAEESDISDKEIISDHDVDIW